MLAPTTVLSFQHYETFKARFSSFPVIVEMLNRAGGIGELIWTAKRQSRIDKAFAILLVIILIGLLQDRLFAWLDRLLFPHKRVARAV